ncbi:hypothetical protein CRM22_001188 [Opisthorchis felineus]|uniref:Uncharacterized protein n=1 Tax=Opisthorchis felineus TaxID=147828 RepID=A0A4S2MBQ4_OPIFE|nr:hypothetical protein CRM22_001188 [Opisthorchis felineus]
MVEYTFRGLHCLHHDLYPLNSMTFVVPKYGGLPHGVPSAALVHRDDAVSFSFETNLLQYSSHTPVNVILIIQFSSFIPSHFHQFTKAEASGLKCFDCDKCPENPTEGNVTVKDGCGACLEDCPVLKP